MTSMSKSNELASKKRKNSIEKKAKSNRGDKTIKIFFDESAHSYSDLVKDAKAYRKYIESSFLKYPELFPESFEQGFKLHDKLESKKINGLIVRRLKLKNGEVYEIMPSNILPYMSGKTDEASLALLLRQWAVPYEVIALIFGRNGMYWERVEESLGRASLVGSLCKTNEIPKHLAADEKITFLNGQETYIALTASNECVLGAELSMKEDTVGLEEAYGVFKAEAEVCMPEYSPKSVNLDGWKATNAAWGNLFPQITLILCYLHAFLKVRDIAKGMKDQYHSICDEIWNVYHQDSKEAFVAAILNLEIWSSEHLKGNERVAQKIQELCSKVNRFSNGYDYENCYRTSNQIDRPMNLLDRYLYQIRYFKGSRDSANKKIRAWGMMYNFTPFCQKVQKRKENPKKTSRFEEFNGFVYHQDWLQNCLIASSLNGKRRSHIIR